MARAHRSFVPFVIAALLAALPAPSTAQDVATDASHAARAPIYDEAADANVLLADAVAKARKENKRVLVMWGGNWCGWCHLLDETLHTDPDCRREMLYEYELVHVDVGHGDKHADLAARLGADHKAHGYPYLTVVDADGRAVVHQETGSLEDGPKHDPQKVLAFLKAHEAPPRDVAQVLAAAQDEARASGRRLFVHLGAPWCGWCHKLEDWMARPEVAAILGSAFVDVKIDQERMTNGMLVATLLRRGEGGGIPWFAFLDADLRPLADSDGPDGNIGFPVAPAEIDHFVSMLERADSTLTSGQIASLRTSLETKSATGAAGAH
ncbi:MAG: thioredoxin family protein [Planctomycetes bacterium]|nr:thioredoxin family protein [Planctomycetota bacterium]